MLVIQPVEPAKHRAAEGPGDRCVWHCFFHWPLASLLSTPLLGIDAQPLMGPKTGVYRYLKTVPPVELEVGPPVVAVKK